MIIASYGDQMWADLAQSRPLPSTRGQGALEVLVGHDPGGTAATSRNGLAAQARGDWLCFLDADDEIAPGYLGAMRRAFERERGTGGNHTFLLTPAVSYVRGPRWSSPMFHPEAPLHVHNWVVIGTLVPKSLFDEVGGFKDYGDPPGSLIYEDWALWGRCELAGARIVKVPRAVYRAHWSEASRNRTGNAMVSARSMWTVGRDVWPDRYPATFEEWQRQHARVAHPERRRVAISERRRQQRRTR